MEFTVQDFLYTSVFGLLIYFLLEYIQTVRQCRLHYPPGPTLWPIFYNKLLYLVRFKSWARTLNGEFIAILVHSEHSFLEFLLFVII